MNAARRSLKRRDWPRGLREPRPGYYTWEHPHTGETLVIGRVSLATAKNEALAANAYVAQHRPTLVDKLAGSGRTIGDLIDRMPVAEKPNTIKTLRSLDKAIRSKLGPKAAKSLTVADCADVMQPYLDAGKDRQAQAIRSRLVAICKEGQALGWMTSNPAEVTRSPRVATKRARLTLEQFRAIHAAAPQVAEWLQHALELALVTGADRSSITSLTRDDIGADSLTISRPKTGARIEIPLRLCLDVARLNLRDVVQHRSGVVSRYLVHHVKVYGNAPAGSRIHPDRFSHAFSEARRLANIPDEGAPTLHEVRSLAARLYADQGGVDVQALLGHKSADMTAVYKDARGIEPIRVKVA